MNLLENQPKKNPALEFDASKSVGNTFDFGKAAGPMQGASSINVSDNMLASKQLDSILSKDNPLMAKARARAGAASARRGLLNSSIGVEAGESAMIDVAAPLAQSDASTNYNAAQFNAQSSNDFARDANSFGRQGAMAKFGVLANQETDGRRMQFDSFENNAGREFTAGENLLERSFRKGERLGSETFAAGENAADRSFRKDERVAGETFAAGQNEVDRTFRKGESALERAARLKEQKNSQNFQSGENATDRAFRGTEADKDRAARIKEVQQSQEFAARQQDLANKFQMDFETFRIPLNAQAGFMERMQGAIGAILADPNLDATTKDADGLTAKDRAIKNYQAYANQTMSWMSRFYKQEMPNVTGGPNFTPPPPAGAPPPAPPPLAPPTQPPPDTPEPGGPTRGIPGRNVGIDRDDTGMGLINTDTDTRTGDQYERFNRWQR